MSAKDGEEKQEKQDQGKVCSGDCLSCSIPQRIYCAAQVGVKTLKLLEELSRKTDALTTEVSELSERIKNLQKEAESLIPSPGK